MNDYPEGFWKALKRICIFAISARRNTRIKEEEGVEICGDWWYSVVQFLRIHVPDLKDHSNNAEFTIAYPPYFRSVLLYADEKLADFYKFRKMYTSDIWHKYFTVVIAFAAFLLSVVNWWWSILPHLFRYPWIKYFTQFVL